MDKIKIEKEALVLDNAEKSKLLICLKYVRHRIEKHGKNIVEDKFVDYLIKNLE